MCLNSFTVIFVFSNALPPIPQGFLQALLNVQRALGVWLKTMTWNFSISMPKSATTLATRLNLRRCCRRVQFFLSFLYAPYAIISTVMSAMRRKLPVTVRISHLASLVSNLLVIDKCHFGSTVPLPEVLASLSGFL